MIEAELEMNAISKFQNISEEVLNEYKNNQRSIFLEEIERLDEQRDIKSLCAKTEKLLNRILKAAKSQIYLNNEDTKKYYCETCENLMQIEENSEFIKYITHRKDLIISLNIREWAEKSGSKDLEETNKIMEVLGARIIIPFIDRK